MYQLVDYIDGCARRTILSISQILLKRDIILVLLTWEIYLRGKDVGKVTLGDFSSPSGPKLVAPFPSSSPAGFSLPLAPYGAKTIRGQRAVPTTSTAKKLISSTALCLCCSQSCFTLGLIKNLGTNTCSVHYIASKGLSCYSSLLMSLKTPNVLC